MVSSCNACEEWCHDAMHVSLCNVYADGYHHATIVMIDISMQRFLCLVSSCSACEEWCHDAMHVMIRYHYAMFARLAMSGITA